MQPCPPKRESRSEWVACLDRCATVQKADAPKRQRVFGRQSDAKLPQYLDARRRNSLAAGLVDWGTRGIDYRGVESLQTNRNRRRQSGRSTTNHEDIGPQYPSSMSTLEL